MNNDNNQPKGEEIPEEAFEALTPDSLADATTEALDEGALGDKATDNKIDKVDNKNHKS